MKILRKNRRTQTAVLALGIDDFSPAGVAKVKRLHVNAFRAAGITVSVDDQWEWPDPVFECVAEISVDPSRVVAK